MRSVAWLWQCPLPPSIAVNWEGVRGAAYKLISCLYFVPYPSFYELVTVKQYILYPGCSWFESQTGYSLKWLTFFVAFLNLFLAKWPNTTMKYNTTASFQILIYHVRLSSHLIWCYTTRGAQTFVRLRLILVNPQYGTCFIFSFWRWRHGFRNEQEDGVSSRVRAICGRRMEIFRGCGHSESKRHASTSIVICLNLLENTVRQVPSLYP